MSDKHTFMPLRHITDLGWGRYRISLEISSLNTITNILFHDCITGHTGKIPILCVLDFKSDRWLNDIDGHGGLKLSELMPVGWVFWLLYPVYVALFLVSPLLAESL